MPMKLAILMLSRNTGLRVNLNLLNASMLGADEAEVILCDLSGDADKQGMLSQINERNCRAVADNGSNRAATVLALLEMTEAEFIFLADDGGQINEHAIQPLCVQLGRLRFPAQVAGMTGVSIVDLDQGSALAALHDLCAETAGQRIQSYLDGKKRDMLHHSPIRREVVKSITSFTASLPLTLAPHRLLTNCLVLTHGKMAFIDRFFIHQDETAISTPQGAFLHELGFAARAGVDGSVLRLQWLLMAAEGAAAFLGKYTASQLVEGEREALAVFWFEYCLQRFRGECERPLQGARFDSEATLLVAKWRERRTMDLPALFADLGSYLSLSSPELGQRYFDFWK